MYVLLKPLPAGLGKLASEFESYVKKCGMEMSQPTTGSQDPSQFVANIQMLHEKFSKAVTDVFSSDEAFQCCLDRVTTVDCLVNI